MPNSTNALSWDKFEEHGKVAFVQNARGSRFFIKTTTNNSKVGQKKVFKVVARVCTHRQTEHEHTHHTSVFHTNKGNSVSLSRITKFLRFAMQEVLGPMKTGGGVASPRSVIATPILPPPTLLSSTMSPQASTKPEKKKKNKKKGGKK